MRPRGPIRGVFGRRLPTCAGVALAAAGLLALPLAASAEVPLPIVFRVAQEKLPDGSARPVVDREFLAKTVERTSEIYRPADMCFVLRDVELLPPGKLVKVFGRWARNGLARLFGPAPAGAIEVFVVKYLANLDGGPLSGVHWRYPSREHGGIGRHYVILGKSHLGIETLAHELGHYFGLPHSNARTNIMMAGPLRIATRFNRWQLAMMGRRLSLFLDEGILARADQGGQASLSCAPQRASVRDFFRRDRL